MEIKIDTKKDSKEDIKQVIAFLQKFIQEGSEGSDFDSSVSEGAFSMFSEGEDKKEEPEKKDDKVRIVEY